MIPLLMSTEGLKIVAIIFLQMILFVGCDPPTSPTTDVSLEQTKAEADIEQTWVGQPGGAALDHFRVGYDGFVTYSGFSAISFETKKEEKPVRVFLWLETKEKPRP